MLINNDITSYNLIREMVFLHLRNICFMSLKYINFRNFRYFAGESFSKHLLGRRDDK